MLENMNVIVFIILLAVAGLSIVTKSYIWWGFSAIAFFAINASYGLGFFSQFLTFVLMLIVFHFIRRRKQFDREQRDIYREGQETARWAKIFDRGFDDECYN